MLRSISFRNFLSFGPDQATLELRSLNVLIGANASGKSNLLEGVALLNSLPDDLQGFLKVGGMTEWLHKASEPKACAEIRARFDANDVGLQGTALEYVVSLDVPASARAIVVDFESLRQDGRASPYFEVRRGVGGIEGLRDGKREEWKVDQLEKTDSVLSLIRVPGTYPELTATAGFFGSWALFRDTWMGRSAAIRRAQQADLPSDRLLEDGTNLAVILNELNRHPKAAATLRSAVKKVYPRFENFHVRIHAGIVQLIVIEGDERMEFPSQRLSDGTVRFLALAAVLCDPKPPPLICIDEPDLGLHPDAVSTLAELLRDAASRTQLIVTTHSTALIDALAPEDIAVVERSETGASTLQRLDAKLLKPWLEKYSLGTLWRRGDIGGNRW